MDFDELQAAEAAGRLIVTEYAYYPSSRALRESPGGKVLTERFQAGAPRYASLLHRIATHVPAFLNISPTETSPDRPFWQNDWIPPLDGMSLYGLLAEHKPTRYIEVGSGISTRFARQVITDLNLPTQIISIDPHPHTAIADLCDQVIQARMEDVGQEIWSSLTGRDMLFLDNSHRAFTGSDVTVFFCEILPALPAGLIWGLHDIFLPNDYPSEWDRRFYNEQYLLMAYLVGGASADEILLPVAWALHQQELVSILSPILGRRDLVSDRANSGGCFWARRKQPEFIMPA